MSPETKTCPDCAESIKAAASVCRYCGHRFDGQTPARTSSAPPPSQTADAPGVARGARDRWRYIVPLLAVMAVGVVAIVAILAVPKIHSAASESSAKRDRASDASAMSDVRNAVSMIETYYAERQTYSGFDKDALIKMEPSFKDTDVQIDVPSPDTYIVVVESKRTHNRFVFGKDPTGSIRKECAHPGRVGCPASGEWG